MVTSMNHVFDFDPHYLFLTAIVTIVMQLSFFAVAATFKFDKVTDFAGGTNFTVLALMTLCLNGNFQQRQLVLSLMVFVWSIRLAGYLLYRILKIGKDDRFDDKRDDFLRFLFFWIFQMLWVWLVSLPITLVNGSLAAKEEVTASDIVGWTLWGLGFIIETIADQQKFAFKMLEENKGKWCNVGLWYYSRHPNYFGELLCWWGLFTSATSQFDALGDWAYFSVIGPIFLTLILLFLSGIPLLERSADKKFGEITDYQKYKKQTSVLILFPPSLFENLPGAVKSIFFLEWPIYTRKKRLTQA